MRYCESSPGGDSISSPGAYVRPEREGGNLFEGCWCPAGALPGFKKVGAPELGIGVPCSRKVQCAGTGRMPRRQDERMGWGQRLQFPSACSKGIVPYLLQSS